MSTPAAGRYVGQSIKRKEDPRLLAGRGRYVDDIQIAGTLHVAFVRSAHARGVITALDTSAAEALPGVHAVFTGKHLNPMVGAFWHTMLGPPKELGGASTYPPPTVLADGDVRFVGDPIAIVIADDRYVAEDAVDLVIVDVDPLPPILDVFAGAAGGDVVHRERVSNVAEAMPVTDIPPLDDIFANAAHVIERRFAQARASNVPMETRGIIVHHDRYQGDLQIWSATQSVHEVKACASRLTGIPESRIRAIANDVGGGFGQKMMVTRDEAAVILAAVAFGDRPLKWIEDRRENLMSANQARSDTMDVSMAVSSDGVILGVKVHFWEDCGAYPTGSGSAAGMAVGMFPGPYKIPIVGPATTAVFTNTCGRIAYRGPWMMETVAREQMMDHIAREIGLDPIEFRRRNIIDRKSVV